jgi:hypothetical protein
MSNLYLYINLVDSDEEEEVVLKKTEEAAPVIVEVYIYVSIYL